MRRTEHESDENLYAYSEGRLGREEAAQAHDHLTHCPECRDRVQEYRLLKIAFNAEPLPETPPGLARRAVDRALSGSDTPRRTWAQRLGRRERTMERQTATASRGFYGRPLSWQGVTGIMVAVLLGVGAGFWVSRPQDGPEPVAHPPVSETPMERADRDKDTIIAPDAPALYENTSVRTQREGPISVTLNEVRVYPARPQPASQTKGVVLVVRGQVETPRTALFWESVPKVTWRGKGSYSSGQQIRMEQNPVFEARIYAAQAEFQSDLSDGGLDLAVEVGTFPADRIRRITLQPGGQNSAGEAEMLTSEGAFHLQLAGIEAETPRLPGHPLKGVIALAEIRIQERFRRRPPERMPFVNVAGSWNPVKWATGDDLPFTLEPDRAAFRERPESEGWRTLTGWLALDGKNASGTLPPITMEYVPAYEREDWQVRFPQVRMVPVEPTTEAPAR
ncbi:MAG: hypothetical protein KY468_02565 [Armatimonadetes bacterium]|nr:hypothetical protein [Armatimonadota bacterium]